MLKTNIQQIDRTVQKSASWIRELSDELSISEEDTYTVLHAIRDRLTIEEATDFAAQLPLLIKGIFYDDYNPSKTPIKISHVEEFFELVMRHYNDNIDLEPIFSVPITIAFLSRKISPGEIEDVKSIIPKEIKENWEDSETLNQ